MPLDVRRALSKLAPHLLQAQAENLNEADTVPRLIKVFEEVLGYDAMQDISREAHWRRFPLRHGCPRETLLQRAQGSGRDAWPKTYFQPSGVRT
jgi:fumarate hydratase class II